MRPGKLKIILLYAAICFIWGSTWLCIKLGLDGVPPLVGASVRFALSGILFLPAILSRRRSLRLNRSGLLLVAVVGGMNFGLSYGCVYWSEQYISSGLASVLFCVYPFFVALLAHYWFGLEDLDWKKLSGIAVGFLGIVVIYADQIHTSFSSVAGMLGIFVASLASSVSLVFLKKHGRELDTLVLNFYCMLFGSALLLLGAIVLERSQPIRWSLKNLSAMLYLAVFGSVVAFTIYFYLLKHMKATQMSFVTLICPVLALLLGSRVLHEQVSSKIILGAALVLFGILIANRTMLPVDASGQEAGKG
jgi:drug/metabolite transporter (DMT)-like permease